MQYVWFKTQEDEDLSLGTREILNDLAKNSLVDPLSILLFSFIFFYGSVLITFTAAFFSYKEMEKGNMFRSWVSGFSRGLVRRCDTVTAAVRNIQRDKKKYSSRVSHYNILSRPKKRARTVKTT